jgi:hypothetical protein
LSAASKTIEEPTDEAAPRPSLGLRLKRLLIAPLLLLRQLRRPKAPAEDETPEEARPDARDARRRDAEETEEAPVAAPSLWRCLLPYGLVLLAGAAAGGGVLYWLSAQVIAHQSTELGEQQDEVARLKGMLAGYDKMMLEKHKKLEEEKGKRAELGNRLAIAQTDLTRRPPPEAGSSAGTQGSAGNPAEVGKTTDCTLRPGSVGNTLKACLEEFNRK